MGCLGIYADVCVAIDFGIGLACGHNIGHFRLEWRWLITADSDETTQVENTRQ